MSIADEILRESLINWALEDLEHPIKRNVLLNMSESNWRDHLYKKTLLKSIEKKNHFSVDEFLKSFEKSQKIEESKPQQEDEIEEWLKVLYKEMYFEIKKEYFKKFQAKRWGMYRINTTGGYRLGPLNAHNQVFMNFKLLYKNGILFWDVSDHRGKVYGRSFGEIPAILSRVVKKQGYDFLIRKNSKKFAIMTPTGTNSSILLNYLRQMKNANLSIGNDEHGNLWIYDEKKKVYEVESNERDNGLEILIKTKDTSDIIYVIKKSEDIELVNDPRLK